MIMWLCYSASRSIIDLTTAYQSFVQSAHPTMANNRMTVNAVELGRALASATGHAFKAMAAGAAQSIRDTILNGQLCRDLTREASWTRSPLSTRGHSTDVMPLNRAGMAHDEYAASQVKTSWYMVLRRSDLEQYMLNGTIPGVRSPGANIDGAHMLIP
eukprot:1719444-Amphidinium_carterae.1